MENAYTREEDRDAKEKVLEALDAAVGHPKMDEMWQKLFKADTVADVEEIMRSCVVLATYQNAEALKVARELDVKVEKLLA